MPATPPNMFVRTIVPIVIGVGVALLGYMVFSNTVKQPGQQPPASSAPPGPGSDAPSTTVAASRGEAPAPPATPPGDDIDPGAKPAAPAGESPGTPSGPTPAPAPAPAPVAGDPARPLGELEAKRIDPPGRDPAPLGDLGVGAASRAKVTFTWNGAGVDSITMAAYFDTIAHKLAQDPAGHYELQRKGSVVGADGRTYSVSSLAAREVRINGARIDLYSTKDASGADRFIWREKAPGIFEAEIVDAGAGGAPVARITRAYELRPGSFDFNVRQSLENLSGRPLDVQWIQYGPIDLREEFTGYRIDVRRLRFGYLLDPRRDPSQSFVEADRHLTARQTLLDQAEKAAAAGLADAPIWPDADKFPNAGRLSWIAQTTRYFSMAIHPLIDPGAAKIDRGLRLAREVYPRMIGVINHADPNAGTARLAVELHSEVFNVAPGAALDLGFAVYAGPLARTELTASSKTDPAFGLLRLNDLVIFNLGGMCAFCTFQWLAVLLFDYLHLLHDWLVFDWAIAIMLLVVTVRTILHPVTRRSQIAMTRFGRQMQALAPKQKKIQEMYKNDPKRLREEMARLMREENVNYAGALGCLPMFLQTPVWIALYAMLYFAFELRHEGAYYGLFQALSGSKWTFLADLSSPDRFITFGGRSFHIPLLSGLMGEIASFNILPLVLGAVFFVQQKYLSPPQTQALTPEQEAQQKMMKWMMVVLFPLMMYNAPSGLAIYFITNSTLGILESRYIRAHIDQLDKNPPPEKVLGRKKVPNIAAGRRAEADPKKWFKAR